MKRVGGAARRVATSTPPRPVAPTGANRPRLRGMWFRRLVDVAFVIAIVLGAIVLVVAVVANT
jgi:hypothetical protein